MRRARRSGLGERIRSRRGAISTLLVMAALGGAAFLPVAAHYGAIPPNGAFAAARPLVASTFYIHLLLNDTSPGFYFGTSSNVVTADAPLSIGLWNNGSVDHSFVVYSVPNGVISSANASTPSALNATLNGHNLTSVWLAPGTNQTVVLNITTSGTYEIVAYYPYLSANFFAYLHVLPPGSASRQYLFVNGTAQITFVPNVATVSPGIPLIVVFGVQGYQHTFTLDACSNDSNIVTGVPLPSNDACLNKPLLDSGFQNPGTTWTSPPTIIPQAGIYWFVCLVPGHFQSGMWGHIYVGVAPTPAASIPQMQNVIQYAYLALGAVVIGGAAFLVLMGQNERAVSAAPAQRPASKD